MSLQDCADTGMRMLPLLTQAKASYSIGKRGALEADRYEIFSAI
jgi:hypothetical protein